MGEIEHERPDQPAAEAEAEAELSSSERADITPRILLFFDYAWPFCYVDQFRFEQLKRERVVEIVLVPFELRPGTPAEGVSAKEHGLGHSERVEEHLRRLAREGGFPLVLPDLIPNTHRALALGELARDGGEARHEAVHRAIFDTYYGRGLDIGNTDVLLEVARAQGFDAEEVASVWDAGTFDERLEQFRHLALHIGIGSTPTALICNELLIGSRPYEVLKAAVDRCLVTPESVAAEISEGSHSELVGSEGSTPADADA